MRDISRRRKESWAHGLASRLVQVVRVRPGGDFSGGEDLNGPYGVEPVDRGGDLAGGEIEHVAQLAWLVGFGDFVDRVQHSLDDRPVDLAAAGEEAVQVEVRAAVEEDCVGRFSVAPCAADLLIVGVQRVGHVVVVDEADVGPVDPHAEGVGGDDQRGVAVQKSVLGRPAFGGVHPSVVHGHLFATLG